MTAHACPICGRPSEVDHRPFCSLRCANVDLQRWLTGGYRLDPEKAEEGDVDRPPGPCRDEGSN